MFRADRQHLHHLLGNLVQHRLQVVKTLYVLVLLFCAGAVAVAITGNWTLGLVLVLLQVVAVLAMRRLGMARQARELAAERLEALRMQRPSWLQSGSRVIPGEPASRGGDPLAESAPREAPAARLPPGG
jgi:hypothetical protein